MTKLDCFSALEDLIWAVTIQKWYQKVQSFEDAKNKKHLGYCICSFKNARARRGFTFLIILPYNAIFITVSFEQFTVPGGFYLPCFIASWPRILLHFKVKLRNRPEWSAKRPAVMLDWNPAVALLLSKQCPGSYTGFFVSKLWVSSFSHTRQEMLI